MQKRIVLGLGQGSLQAGFPAVTAHLWEAANLPPMKFAGALPPAPELSAVYRDWQVLYRAMHQRLDWHPRMEIEAADVTNVSEAGFNKLCQRLAKHINTWLNAAEFHPIDQRLRTYLNTTDEICLVIETDDELLQRLPWHLWHFFDDYPHAEVALSPSSYQRATPVQTSGRQVKILVVLGSSVGIKVKRDLTHIYQFAPRPKVRVLREPSLKKLTQALWRGCDLLFFSGHSSSQGQGTFQLNAEQSLTVEKLK